MRRRLHVPQLLALTAICLGLAAAPNPATGTPERPDLKVRVELQKEQRLGKWYVRMRFTVFNDGLALAGPSTLGTWWRANAGGPCPAVDGVYDLAPPVEAGATQVVKLVTPPIPPGLSVFVLGPNTKKWPPGRYTITARADFLSVIVETNEANNQGSAAISIP